MVCLTSPLKMLNMDYALKTCSLVKKANTKNSRSDHALYLIYFPNKYIKLQELKPILNTSSILKYPGSHIYLDLNQRQCNNCQLHGHGSKNCDLPPRCSKFGGKHIASACMRDQFPQPEQVYKRCLVVLLTRPEIVIARREQSISK